MPRVDKGPSVTPMTTFAIEYTYDAARSTEMDEIRPAHRQFLGTLHDAGTLLMAGSWKEPSPAAYLFVEADSPEAALALVEDDPFHVAGLITSRTAHPFNPVFGTFAK